MTTPPHLRNLLRANCLIRFLYYNCHLADIPVLLGIGQFKYKADKQMKSFLSKEELADKDICSSVYSDIKSCYYRYKTTPEEYFLFGLRNKSKAERGSYISDSMIMKYTADKGGRLIHDAELNDKFAFYQINKPFFRRKAMIFDSTTTKDQIVEFVMDVKRVISKPNKAALGAGVEIFTVTDKNSAEKVYNHLKDCGNEFILEEVIRQSPEMASWNDSSVNTIRINSFLHNGHLKILCPFIRTGRKGSIVDNGGQGGIFASVDKDSGKISTPGMDEKGNVYETHPDSGIEYIGWQVPRWSELLNLAEEVHKNMSNHIYVSWDFALTSTGWVLIEGNWGEFVCQQMTNKRGFKKDFLSYLNAK